MTVDLLGTVWTISPAVSPKGPMISTSISHNGTSAMIYLDIDQARAIARELIDAADWCEAHA